MPSLASLFADEQCARLDVGLMVLPSITHCLSSRQVQYIAISYPWAGDIFSGFRLDLIVSHHHHPRTP